MPDRMLEPKAAPHARYAAFRVAPAYPGKPDLMKLIAEIKAALGINLAGVHGAISSIQKRSGVPFSTTTTVSDHGETYRENDTCPLCDTVVPRANAHACFEVVLYGASGNTDTPGVKFAPHGLDVAGLATLDAVVKAHKVL